MLTKQELKQAAKKLITNALIHAVIKAIWDWMTNG